MIEHGVDGESVYVNGEWARSCKCGRTFVSRRGWRHVPALYDHLATTPRSPVRRTMHIRIAVTDAEREMILRAAEQSAGRSVSGWAQLNLVDLARIETSG